MSRSARDATRFTQNVAQSYTRASPPSAGRIRHAASPTASGAGPFASNAGRDGTFNSNLGRRPPVSSNEGETAQQKVARLRAEHMQRKAAQLTTWDRIILRGRNFADAAHRWTIFGILSFSAIAGAITIYSAIDMIRYNRRKNKEFYLQYQQLWEKRHADAVTAEAAGLATDTQLAIVQQEREAQQFYEKKEKTGVWSKVKSVFSFKGLSDDAAGTHAWDKQEDLLKAGEGIVKSEHWAGKEALSSVEEHRRVGEKQLKADGYQGGPLDQAAEEVVRATVANGKDNGWFSWGKR